MNQFIPLLFLFFRAGAFPFHLLSASSTVTELEASLGKFSVLVVGYPTESIDTNGDRSRTACFVQRGLQAAIQL